MTLKELLLITSLLFVSSLNSFACLETYQFKIFPVGIYENQIISVDVMIKRKEARRLRSLGYDLKSGTLSYGIDTGWLLITHISHYDFKQNVLSTTALDSMALVGEDYSVFLAKMYQAAFNKIKSDYYRIELFDIEYHSFCDYQQNCNRIAIEYDSTEQANVFIYKNQNYPSQLFQKAYYYGTKHRLNQQTIDSYYINSIRVYKSGNKKLVISHLQTGHGIIIDGTQIISTETETDIPKYGLANCTYQEPTLYHGFGFDAFFVVEE